MMVNFKNLSNFANKAKDAVEKRGGTDALKQDAEHLKSIARGPGSLSDKAKAAAAALKEAGAEMRAGAAGTSEAPTSATEPKATGAKADAPKPAAKTGTPKKATTGKANASTPTQAAGKTKASTPKQAAGKAKADAAANTGTAAKDAGKRPPAEEVGGAK